MSGETPGEPGLFGDEERTPSPFFERVEAAERELGARRGRPPGARNRKSVDFEKWYHAAGFKDPAVFLAELVSADPMALARAASLKIADAIGIQKSAAAELMPYLHGKAPTRIEITDERLPTLIIVSNSNQLEEAQQLLAERQALSLGTPLEIEGEAVENPANPGLSEGEE